jgi:two-component system response regulator (stage 0 sporulation protein A)
MGCDELQKIPTCGILLAQEWERGKTGMGRMKLLIAEGNEAFRMALAELLGDVYDLRLSGEGNEAMELLYSFRPDLLLLDLMLPGLDGITILERAVAAGLRPMVLATTRFASEYTLEQAGLLGVCYVMKKPCDLRATVARLSDLGQRISQSPGAEADPRVQVSNLLVALGIETKWKGYGCLREAILLMARERDQSMTKELYPAVAKICGGDWESVERTCRSAIQKAWAKRDRRLWQLYFPGEGPEGARRPSNRAFISRLADAIRLRQGA